MATQKRIMGNMNTIEFSPNGIGSISKALVALRAKLNPLIKRDVNPHFGSKYASLDDVLKSVNDALAEAEVAPIQGTAAHDDGSILIETMLLHGPSAEWVKTGITLKPSKNDPQGAGSCITYGRRYTLQAILAIAAEDDDGNAASQSNVPYDKSSTQYREYKLDPPQPSSAKDTEPQWVQGKFGPVNKDRKGEEVWYSDIAGKNIWTKDVTMADSMRDSINTVVRAHIRYKTPQSKSAQILAFIPADEWTPEDENERGR